MKKIFVTGGAGFIGSNFIINKIYNSSDEIINYDKLTYSGNLDNLKTVEDHPRYTFYKGDISDKKVLTEIFLDTKPDQVINFAAESHVDRSISGPEDFIQTNIFGSYNLLEALRYYWLDQSSILKNFRILHVSTDEVFGSLGPEDLSFTEECQFKPNSPYSASKAASDHLFRAWNRTYQLPILITNCSNNFGPRQFPEKLIPHTIICCIKRKEIPIYGNGLQIRDWLHVDDHNNAINKVLDKGKVGETYNIGGNNEVTNIDLVKKICNIMDDFENLHSGNKSNFSNLITHVEDRPGHDIRYSIDITKIEKEIGWKNARDFDSSLKETVEWYLDNPQWIENISSGSYNN